MNCEIKSHTFFFQIILNSMHKYQPRLHIVKREPDDKSSVNDLENEEYRTFVFPETVFIGVTAYQNQLVSRKYFSIIFHMQIVTIRKHVMLTN